ncbi:MAG: hypothetical protein LBP86_03125 [Azoarcus sp.]|nr:hypothetical protein [Azoarcus sp.]
MPCLRFSIVASVLCAGLFLPRVDAQEATPSIDAEWLFSHDSDKFDEARISLGYRYANGWGVNANLARYRAPDWSASGRCLAATYARREASRSLEAALGATRTGNHTMLAGRFDYLQSLTENTALGLSAERDVVDSVQGINQGIAYTTLMLVADHNFGPRSNVGIATGQTWFSDDNRRPILRMRWNYELLPEHGLSAYLKTRHYRNTRPYHGNYYAPERLGEASLGLSWRTALNDHVVFFTGADAGRQRVDHDANVSIWNVLAGLQSHRRAPVQWRIALEISNNAPSMFSQSEGSYRYFSLTGYLRIPLY